MFLLMRLTQLVLIIHQNCGNNFTDKKYYVNINKEKRKQTNLYIINKTIYVCE